MSRAELLRILLGLLLAVIGPAGERAWADGEAVNGFPNWSERVLLEWINRARSDPAADLAGCPSGNCKENTGGCYTPQPPRVLNPNIAHSGRFHSDEMAHDNFFDHWSECTVVNSIASTYLAQPQQCDGTASCACTGGTRTLGFGAGTDPHARMSLFGGGAGSWGEIIAEDGAGPNDTFYLFLYEPAYSASCADVSNPNPPYQTNGHRWLILTSQYGASSAGPGVSSAYSTVDFDDEAAGSAKIPSGTHYPQQAASVDAWVNWHDTAGPSMHKISVDGVCTDMALARGTQTNGAWHLSVSGVGSGCHRYMFFFQDSIGNAVRYPTTGSLAIGDGSAQCPDWSSTAVAPCADVIFANGFEP
jgi:hypothetical protein